MIQQELHSITRIPKVLSTGLGVEVSLKRRVHKVRIGNTDGIMLKNLRTRYLKSTNANTDNYNFPYLFEGSRFLHLGYFLSITYWRTEYYKINMDLIKYAIV